MSTTVEEPRRLGTTQVTLPRITIKFCVQCKWNLRAAYYAQELLQTFSTSIGEISLVPVTGGVFTVTILHHSGPEALSSSPEPVETVLWDRKTEGGFPETKELKNHVRNIIDPEKDMGHIDRRLRKDKEEAEGEEGEEDRKNSPHPRESEQPVDSTQPELCTDCK